MKLIKLSLAAAFVLGLANQASAIALEDAIKDVETSGMVRYRYDTDRIHLKGRFDKTMAGSAETKGIRDGYNASLDQTHNYKAYFNFKAALNDNFKIYVQLQYVSMDAGFYTDAGTPAQIKNSLDVKQMYFEYLNKEYATRVRMGKQEIDTIWTDDSVASGVKVFNNSFEHFTLLGFWLDDYSYDDMLFLDPTLSQDGGGFFITGSTYGGAIFANYDPVAIQLWGAYNNNLATLYALDVQANTNFGGLNLGAHVQYLGNIVQDGVKNLDFKQTADGYGVGNSIFANGVKADNGSYVATKLYGDYMGFDFAAGYYQYGKKDKFSFTSIEDCGELIYGGESLIYSTGSLLRGGIGENKYFFGTLGYTYDKFRIGVDYVGGTTDRAIGSGYVNSIDKNEVVGRLSYTYSPKLEFSSFYSWYQEDGIQDLDPLSMSPGSSYDSEGKFVRFEVLYKW